MLSVCPYFHVHQPYRIKQYRVFDIGNDKYDLKNFTRFGTESNNGFTANIIDADLTGVELRISLPIYKLSDCKC